MSKQKTEWILDLVDRFTTPIANATRGVEIFTKSTTVATFAVDKMQERSEILSGRLVKIGLTAAGFFTLANATFAFETSMRKANTMASLGQAQFELLTNQIRGVAQVIPLAKTELAEGLYQTISNGVPENNWIDFLNSSSKTAVGGVADVGEVVSVTSTIIKNYGFEWTKAGLIQDKIQNTAKLGKTSFGELASALPSVTGSAAILNVGLDELLGTFSALTGVTGTTSEVGTQLNAIFSAMVKPASEATEMAKKLGIQFDALSIEKSGGLKKFFDILTSSVESYSKKTGIATTTIYGQLFSSQEALRAFLPITGAVSKDFTEKTAIISNSAGVINRAFAEMSSGSEAKMQIMKNSFSNALDKIVFALQPLINGILYLASILFVLFGRFSDGHPILFKTVILVGALTIGFITVSTSLQLLGNSFLITAIKNNALLLSMWNTAKVSSLNAVRFLLVTARILAYRAGIIVLTLLNWRFYYSLMNSAIGLIRNSRAFVIASAQTAIYYSRLAIATIFNMNFYKSMLMSALSIARTILQYVLIGVAMGSYLVAVSAVTAAQWLFNIALSANPIGAIIIGIVALIAAVSVLIKYWDQITASVSRFGNMIWGLIAGVFPEFGESVKRLFEKILGWFSKMWDKITGAVKKVGGWLGITGDAQFDVNYDLPTNNVPPPSQPPPVVALGGGITPAAFPLNTGGSAAGYSGNGSSGKTVTMNLSITNIFNANGDGDFERNIDRYIDKITGKLNDRLRDAAIQF